MEPLAPPTSWRKSDISISMGDRIALAKAAIDKSVNLVDPTQPDDVSQSGTLYSQMAAFDLVTKQTIYKGQLKALFTATAASNPGFKNELGYGYAATLAYSVYKDPQFLTWAQSIWQVGRNFALSADDIISGKIPAKNFTLEAACSGSTMAGGTFQNININDPALATSETA
ncbi:hypothetical protein C8J56DRAFT_969940 [Mycena floridula]|nr:hypothetical protein C8J56DRAFT_969940 [Mycena floridula]